MATISERNKLPANSPRVDSLEEENMDLNSSLDDEKMDLFWEDHHRNFFRRVSTLCATESLTDVTISCQNSLFEAHQLILSASSEYFRNIFSKKSNKTIIIYLKNVKASVFQAILAFIYNGEVQIEQDILEEIMEVANELQIEGIYQIEENEQVVQKENNKDISDPRSCDEKQLSPGKNDIPVVYENIPVIYGNISDPGNYDEEHLSSGKNRKEFVQKIGIVHENVPDTRNADKEQSSIGNNKPEIIYDNIPDSRIDDIKMKREEYYMKKSGSDKLSNYNDIVKAIRDMENTNNQNITHKNRDMEITKNDIQDALIRDMENTKSDIQNVTYKNRDMEINKNDIQNTIIRDMENTKNNIENDTYKNRDIESFKNDIQNGIIREFEHPKNDIENVAYKNKDMENSKNGIQNIIYKSNKEVKMNGNAEEGSAESNIAIKIENSTDGKQNNYPENAIKEKTEFTKIPNEIEWIDKFEYNFESTLKKYVDPNNDILKSIKDIKIREHLIPKTGQIIEIIDGICNFVFSKVGKKIPSIKVWRRLTDILQINIPATFRKGHAILLDDGRYTLEELFLRNFSKCLENNYSPEGMTANSQHFLRKLEDNFDDLIPEAKFVKSKGVLNNMSHNQILGQICYQISREIGMARLPLAIFQNIVSILTKKVPEFYRSTTNPAYTIVNMEDGKMKRKGAGGLVKLEKKIQSKFYEKYRRPNQAEGYIKKTRSKGPNRVGGWSPQSKDS